MTDLRGCQTVGFPEIIQDCCFHAQTDLPRFSHLG